MGCCFSGESEEASQQPDLDTRRRLQAEAAEHRLREEENRGIANLEAVKRQQKKDAAAENLGKGGSGLRWRVSS
nr:expressed conserved protein [Hymenolepis microstoma]